MPDPVELDALLERQAARMDFFQVLRLIENAHPQLPRIGASLRPRDDAVRFGQDPALVFHATTLGQFTRASGEARARLAVNFFGLLGANGPLPIHLTEYVRDRLRQGGDATMLAFLDVFHHRMLSLFYRARASAEPAISLDRADGDRFSVFVGSLFGIGAPALRNRDHIGDFAKLHFAGLLGGRTRPASGLATILREYFQLPLHIEQFVGHWMALPLEIHSRIGAGGDGNRLGASLVLGRKVWDCQHKFRVVIGPLGYDDYRRFMPGGDSLRRLRDWIRMYAGLALDWDVRLILKKEDVPPLALGGTTRVGWSTWLTSTAPYRDPDQMRIGRRAIESTT
ncbi:type VI secretion system baseplate subunit TssG [Massilia eurypsychrophila]|uniref:Type VI secretion system baseplate subunit TssG n=1 Tax=Massilia eurypsychrophila TaxID=1485217 RepID=A0A2G8TG09_9BURK|nr:type VI secretion system baseplate subunit TssG [Massilia eurypsychrophila]PIL44987.1 type VI secretion system baseplate subunit TssG [Massilia eurypsychrophila]